MPKYPLLLLCLGTAASCSYYMDHTVQNVTVETLGARNAICYAYIDNVKYKIRPPMKIALKKDKEPMLMDCLAPGNRRKNLKITPKLESATLLNTLNGGVGATWDYGSDAMFAYPEKIYVDFRGVKTSPMALPDHNSPDIVQPEEYDLEEFVPAQPRMNADKYKKPQPILRREEYVSTDFSEDNALSQKDFNPAAVVGEKSGKGSLMPVKTQSLPPVENSLDPSTETPVQLFPLQ